MGILTAFRLLRAAIIAVGLISLAFVLVPAYVEPLWSWVTFITSGIGTDVLPSFDETRHLSSMALAGFVLCGVVYSVWRDRRFRRLQAEYAYRTGAGRLKEKAANLETQLNKTIQERDDLEQAHEELTQQLTAALVSSKEHEVRSEYGRADRQVLGELRKEFDGLMRAKGNLEGFREAMHMFLTNHNSEETPEVCVERSAMESGKTDQPALPYLARYAKSSDNHELHRNRLQ